MVSTTVPPPAIAPSFLDRLFLRGFYKRLQRRLRDLAPALVPTVPDVVRAEALRLHNQNLVLVVDAASASHLIMTSTVLAAYRTLQAHPETRAPALELTRALFVDTGKGATQLGMKLFPYLVRDPFRSMVNISKNKQLAYYGKSFTFDMPQDDDDAFILKVHGCFYNSFFLSQGAPELGAMFCEKDNTWSDGIDPQKAGFTFQRPTTLARGGDCCSFEFVRLGRAP